jgi:hypothetical protein
MSSLLEKIRKIQKELKEFISYKGAKLSYSLNNKPPISFDDFYKSVKRFITAIERLNNTELSKRVSKLDLNIENEWELHELESDLVCIFDILEDVLYKKNKETTIINPKNIKYLISETKKNINSLDLKEFFYEMNIQLNTIKDEYDEIDSQINEDNWDYYATCHPDIFDSCNESYKAWEKQLLVHLNRSYKIKVKRMTSPLSKDDEYLILKTVLRDMWWKYNRNKSKSEKNFAIEKLLKAREGNIEFELELAKMITGENNSFPSHSGENIKRFFQNLGEEIFLLAVHPSTKQPVEELSIFVEKKIKEFSIVQIHDLIIMGLFKKKYFQKYVNEINFEIDVDSLFKQAEKEFKKFIQNSMRDDNPFSLSNVLDMNVNIELLFDNKADTKDIELNKLIEEAKERFLSNDKQIGLEKLWDAYERLKTHFADTTIESNKKRQKDKGKSAEKVANIITENFDKAFIDNEFKALTNIGNGYRIRHHERGKKELTPKHINYFFFRMMSLVDLCLMYFNEEKI